MDLTIRVGSMHTDLQTLTANLNIFIKKMEQELEGQKHLINQNQSEQQNSLQLINELRTDLTNKQDQILSIHSQKLAKQLEQFQLDLQQQKEQDLDKMQQLQLKIVQFDVQVDQIIKKFEMKSTDRYIATLIQNSLLNDREIANFVVEKAMIEANKLIDSKIDDYTKSVDERITQQYSQIQNLISYMRKEEKNVEEAQISLKVTRESLQEIQKQQNKKISQQNSQINMINDKVSENITQVNMIQEEVKEKIQRVNQSHIEIRQYYDEVFKNLKKEINDIAKQYSNQIQQLEQQFKADQKIHQNFKMDIQQYQNNLDIKLTNIESDISNIKLSITQLQEQQKTPITKSVYRQRIQPQKSPQRQPTLKEQMSQLENLFVNVSTLYKYIQRSYKTSPEFKSDQSPQQSKEILVQENPHFRSTVNAQNDFDDTKMQQTTSRPLYVIGKQQFLDIRPSAEISNIQAKIRHFSNMVGDEIIKADLQGFEKPVYNTGRPASGKNKLPSLNRSLNSSFIE